MKRILSAITAAIIFAATATAAIIGEWKAYPAYDNTTKVAIAGHRIYAASSGFIYCYDQTDNSVAAFNKVNGLNDYNVSAISYSSHRQALVIAYANSNIDVLTNDGHVINIPDLKLKTMSQDKTINAIYNADKYSYIATGFGVCAVDISRGEIYESYNIDANTYDVVLEGYTLYAATENGIMTGDIRKNLLDKSNWEMLCQDKVKQMAFFNGTLYCSMENGGLHKCDLSTGRIEPVNAAATTYSYLNVCDDRLLFGTGNQVNMITENGGIIKTTIDTELQDAEFSASDGLLWGAVSDKGLYSYRWDAETSGFALNASEIRPDGPLRNYFYDMKFENGKLFIVGGGFDGVKIYNPGTVMFYQDGKWSTLQDGDPVSQLGGYTYMNVVSVAQDPTDETHHFVGSAFGGLYEFKDGIAVNLYSCDNSPLESASQNNRQLTRAGALNYDRYNNLWLTNSSGTEPIKAIKPDGTWVSLPFMEISRFPTLDKMIIDSRGWLWGTSRFSEEGIYCIDYNGTVDNFSDDRYAFLGAYVNQDGASTSARTYDICEDRDGDIWIGTESGPFVIYNAERLPDADPSTFQVTQIKIPRNDGSNLADFLLSGERINVIKVDGANRKWIGTENTGLYLISADGQEMIHHFDETNSPLFGNAIRSLAIDNSTGEVFIGTDYGLLSYMSDATEPQPSFNDEIYAYPNPVEPGYEDVIAIKGLVEDTDVKITDTAARVIAQGKSNGGMFAWDGRDASGRLVPTGIYLVFAADASGKSGIVTKITVIR